MSGISYISLFGIRICCFHAGKGFIIGAGVSNIMILSVPVHLSQCLCESRTSAVLHSGYLYVLVLVCGVLLCDDRDLTQDGLGPHLEGEHHQVW